jgi:SM-20-related protein
MLALTPTLGLSLALSLSRSTTQHLQQHGYAVVPNFVAPQTVEALKRDVSQLHAEGRFATAGVGESGTNRVETTVRKCQQCFIFPQFKYKSGGDEAARATLYGALESLRDDLQTHCGVPLDGLLTEGLYATYPNGGFYRRHVDAVEGTASAQRQWSYLLYLNTDWKEADGGCLRIHTDGGGELAPPGAAPSYVDVEPRAGTLAIFRSMMPHEVLDTDAQRLAVAGWLNRPVEGSDTRRKLIAGLAGALLVGNGVKFGLAALQGGDGK